MKTKLFSILALLSACLMALVFSSCGDGSDTQSPHTFFQGVLLDTNGSPVTDATIFIFDTNEAVIVDESGAFFLESFRHLTSARFYAFTSAYTNSVDLETIPDEAALVNINFTLDRSTNTLSIASVSFENTAPPSLSSEPASQSSEPTSEGSESASSEESTVNSSNSEVSQPPSSGSATSSQASLASSHQNSSAASSVARPSATPTPSGNFDSNGNTSAFGIPSGMTGNVNAGRSVWNSQCKSCHAQEKTGRSYNQIKSSFRTIPQMQGLSVNNQQIANVTAYLNRGRN